MREYGIDGAFLQRFATTTRDPRFRKPMDDVLKYVADAARETGRAWAVMYDLTGLKPDQIETLKADWKRVDEQFHLRNADEHPGYLRHQGRPLVALWGCGFSDRPAMLEEWRALICVLQRRSAVRRLCGNARRARVLAERSTGTRSPIPPCIRSSLPPTSSAPGA